MWRAWLLALASSGLLLAQKQPFTVQAMMRLQRIGDPQVSPDGKLVAFGVTSIDVAGNKRSKQIWVVPLEGGAPRQITKDGEANERPRWSPDGRRIAYISARGGSAQVWLMDPDGANAKPATNLSTEAGGVLFSPDGKQILVTSDVYPECGADDACNKKLLDAEKNDPVKARIYTALLYRHWTTWQGKRRSHLLAVPLGGGPARDLTPGPLGVPPFSLGGADDYAISPDGQEVCYAANLDPVPAVSTSARLFVVPIAGGAARRITATLGGDAGPQYSPDGKYVAWRAQFRPGFESDRWRLLLMERSSGRITSLTENLDRWVTGFAWSPDSNGIFFTMEDRGRAPIQYVPVTGGAARVAVGGDFHFDDMQLTHDGKTMVYTASSGAAPAEIFRASSSGGPQTPLTRLNDAVLTAHQLTPLEEFWVDADGARVQSFLVKPPGFRESRKYPVMLLIHGGPQGAWGQSWTYRWNAQVFAAAGYVVVMPNPRGSTGYGQKFTDDISGDWGGKVFDDLMAVADHMVSNVPYADATRMTAAGGSYGGYMVNWILGHTARFKALISHAGVYDLRSMFGETEELWFPLWEFQGSAWDNPEMYVRWSPSQFVKEFKTPTLVIHGEQDYRVPFGQGLQLFTALQLQKVPSKLLLYPDEGHWINKPQNSLLWYKTFIEWMDSWVKK